MFRSRDLQAISHGRLKSKANLQNNCCNRSSIRWGHNPPRRKRPLGPLLVAREASRWVFDLIRSRNLPLIWNRVGRGVSAVGRNTSVSSNSTKSDFRDDRQQNRSLEIIQHLSTDDSSRATYVCKFDETARWTSADKVSIAHRRVNDQNTGLNVDSTVRGWFHCSQRCQGS